MHVPRYMLIANPGTKRCELYRRELIAFWSARGVAVDLETVPWADIVLRGGALTIFAAFDRPAIVRLESPGKDHEVTRLLLESGARGDPDEPRVRLADARDPEGATRAARIALPRIPPRATRDSRNPSLSGHIWPNRLSAGHRRDVRQDRDMPKTVGSWCASPGDAR